jgi:hypothetical protein
MVLPQANWCTIAVAHVAVQALPVATALHQVWPHRPWILAEIAPGAAWIAWVAMEFRTLIFLRMIAESVVEPMPTKTVLVCASAPPLWMTVVVALPAPRAFSSTSTRIVRVFVTALRCMMIVVTALAEQPHLHSTSRRTALELALARTTSMTAAHVKTQVLWLTTVIAWVIALV